jgi:JmjC domain
VHVEIDDNSFPAAFGRRPVAVRHDLVEHPLLSLEAIAQLADRFPGRIERHRADLPLVLPGGAPELSGPPSETVREIDHNGCWVVFWYLELDPEYKALLDACLDEVEPHLPSEAGGSRRREAFLFLSSPHALTPVHFDHEHNFLLQIKGRKDMHVCPFPSGESERRELERLYDGGEFLDRNLGAVPSEGENFRLEPGGGVYVPSFMPHWVQNGPGASISLSITFRTPASLRLERVHLLNARLRRAGLSPSPPGGSGVRDRVKECLWLALGPSRRLASLRRSRGQAGSGRAAR